MNEFIIRLSCLVVSLFYKTFATIDVNLNELEYLAARLDPFECRRLIAALHYTTYELPKSLAAAERKVDDEIPCFRQLLHWNSSPAEGKGKTHEAIVHRLRQLNRNDLADWLGKTAFKQLGKDIDKAMVKPFKEIMDDQTEISYPVSIGAAKKFEDEDPWTSINIVLIAILLGLLGTLLTFICMSIAFRLKIYFRTSKYKKLQEQAENSERNVNKEVGKCVKYSTESSADISDNVRTETETDTDFS